MTNIDSSVQVCDATKAHSNSSADLIVINSKRIFIESTELLLLSTICVAHLNGRNTIEQIRIVLYRMKFLYSQFQVPRLRLGMTNRLVGGG